MMIWNGCIAADETVGSICRSCLNVMLEIYDRLSTCESKQLIAYQSSDFFPL